MTSVHDLQVWLSATYGDSLVPFCLVFTRMLAIVVTLPFFGAGCVTRPGQTGIAFVLSLVLFPAANLQWTELPAALPLLYLCTKEVAIGFTLGFSIRLFLVVMEMSGELTDFMLGLRHEGILAPQFASRPTPLGMLQMQAVLGLFFAMGGHRLFLQTVARSFEQFPIGWFPYAAATATVIESLVRLTGMALSATLQVGAPVLVCVFTTHIGVAALARSLHAQTLHEEASAVKIWIGFCVLALTAATVLDTSWEVFARLLKGVGEVI